MATPTGSYTTKLHCPSPYDNTTIVVLGNRYVIDDQSVLTTPSKQALNLTIPSNHALISKHQCNCNCTCCSPKLGHNITLADLNLLKATMIKEGEEAWADIANLRKDYETLLRDRAEIAKFIMGYKVIGIDRSECWKYVNHDMWCNEDACVCNVVFCSDKFCTCRCPCCSKTPVSMTYGDRKIYEQWLYYAGQLYKLMKRANSASHRKTLLTVDPWSLQEKWCCITCRDFSVVHVYNNRGYANVDEFYLCLSCLTMFETMTLPTRRGTFTRFKDIGKYDLC